MFIVVDLEELSEIRPGQSGGTKNM